MPQRPENNDLPTPVRNALGGIVVGSFDAIAFLMTKHVMEAGVKDVGQMGLFLLMDFVGLGATSWYLTHILSPKENSHHIGRQRRRANIPDWMQQRNPHKTPRQR